LSKTETEFKCQEFGVNKFFLKPFNPVELVGTINEMIENSRIEAQHPVKAI
jgi:response regulator RpfG family c-di-GMP phosphodiesterase